MEKKIKRSITQEYLQKEQQFLKMCKKEAIPAEDMECYQSKIFTDYLCKSNVMDFGYDSSLSDTWLSKKELKRKYSEYTPPMSQNVLTTYNSFNTPQQKQTEQYTYSINNNLPTPEKLLRFYKDYSKLRTDLKNNKSYGISK